MAASVSGVALGTQLKFAWDCMKREALAEAIAADFFVANRLAAEVEALDPYFQVIFNNIDYTAPRVWEKDALRFKETLKRQPWISLGTLIEEIRRFAKDNRIPIILSHKEPKPPSTPPRFGKILSDVYQTHDRLQDLLLEDNPKVGDLDLDLGDVLSRRRPFILQRNEWRHLLGAYNDVLRQIDDVLVKILRGPLEALLLAMESAERSLTQCIAPHIYETRTTTPHPSASSSDGDDAWMTKEPLLLKEQQQEELQLWLLQKALKHALGNEVQHLHMDNLRTCSMAFIEALANSSDLNHIPFHPPPPPAPPTDTCHGGLDLHPPPPPAPDLLTLLKKVLYQPESRTSINLPTVHLLEENVLIHAGWRRASTAISDSLHTVAQFVHDRLSFTSDTNQMMQRLKAPTEFTDIIDENGDKKRLGKGGYGEVYEKKWMLDKHHVAVKVMEAKEIEEESGGVATPTSTSMLPTATTGFSRLFHKICGSEVITQARVYHPNLLPLLCCKEKLRGDGYMEISMATELMQYDLNEFITKRNTQIAPFPLHVSVDIMLQIAKGMEYLHQHNIIHRDLKPHNILISCSPHCCSSPHYSSPHSVLSSPDNHLFSICVKVADFGSSKAIANNHTYVLMSHTSNIGTSFWRAPEVLDDHNWPDTTLTKYNKKVDVYSFAMVSYQIMTGKVPFFNEPNLHRKIKVKHYRPRFDNSDSSPSCPEALIDMIRTCWDPDPLKRPNFSKIAKFLRYMKVCAIRLAGYEELDYENRLKQMCKESRRMMVMAAMKDHTCTVEEEQIQKPWPNWFRFLWLRWRQEEQW